MQQAQGLDLGGFIVISSDSENDSPPPRAQTARGLGNDQHANVKEEPRLDFMNTWPNPAWQEMQVPRPHNHPHPPVVDARPARIQNQVIDLTDLEPWTPPASQHLDATTPKPLVADSTIFYEEVEERVKAMFPEICTKFLRDVFQARVHAFTQFPSSTWVEDVTASVILHVCDLKTYPKQDKPKKTLKRKRTDGESSDEEAKEWTAPGRIGMTAAEIRASYVSILGFAGFVFLYLAKSKSNEERLMTTRSQALKLDFKNVPVSFIQGQLKSHATLYAAYRAIEAADRVATESTDAGFQRLKKPRKPVGDDLANFPNVQRELEVVRRRRRKEEGKHDHSLSNCSLPLT